MVDIARERLFLSQQGLDIIPRSAWSTQSYGSDRTVFEPVEGFFLHISVTIDHGDLTGDEHRDMRTIERIGNERFNGIGFPYNAAIFDTGRLYEGQPLTRRGAHTVNDENKPGFRETGSGGSLNYWYRAIVLPQMVTDDVTDAQVDQIAKWAAAQIRAGYAKRTATWNGHRDVSAKSCPGDIGYARLPEIRQLTEHYVRNGLNPAPEPPPEPEDDDMQDLMISAEGKSPAWVRGDKVIQLVNASSRDNLVKDGGVKAATITPGDYDRMIQVLEAPELVEHVEDPASPPS
jgi:hypothetical protein